MLKVLILPLNVLISGVFNPKFCIFGGKISDKNKTSDNFPTAQDVAGQLLPCPSPRCPPATTPLYDGAQRRVLATW